MRPGPFCVNARRVFLRLLRPKASARPHMGQERAMEGVG